MDNFDKRVATVAVVSATIIALSILTGVIVGELPDALWLLVVPVGMLGAGLVCMASLGILVARRLGRT